MGLDDSANRRWQDAERPWIPCVLDLRSLSEKKERRPRLGSRVDSSASSALHAGLFPCELATACRTRNDTFRSLGRDLGVRWHICFHAAWLSQAIYR
jgi:hypothetical protein